MYEVDCAIRICTVSHNKRYILLYDVVCEMYILYSTIHVFTPMHIFILYKYELYLKIEEYLF